MLKPPRKGQFGNSKRQRLEPLDSTPRSPLVTWTLFAVLLASCAWIVMHFSGCTHNPPVELSDRRGPTNLRELGCACPALNDQEFKDIVCEGNALYAEDQARISKCVANGFIDEVK